MPTLEFRIQVRVGLNDSVRVKNFFKIDKSGPRPNKSVGGKCS